MRAPTQAAKGYRRLFPSLMALARFKSVVRLQSFTQAAAESLRCTLYTDAVQAALRGQGITLGWRRMVQDDLSAGRLVRVTEASIKPDDGYHAVIPHGKELSPVMQTLVNWMRHEPGRPSSV